MVVTVIALALFLAAGGVLAFLIIQGRARDRLYSVFEAKAYEPFAVFSVIQAFDPDFAVIWDTQTPALQLVDEASIQGLPVHRLQPFYARSARMYPELYDGSSFGGWLDFLEREQLIDRSGRRVFITAEGHEFLTYRLVPKAVLAV